jgi:hypothetical protein
MLNFSKIPNNKLIISLAFLLYFPVILLNEYFLDDRYRIINNYYNWSTDYRPLADFIYYIIGFSFEVIDTFPLNYIFQIIILIFFVSWISEKIIHIYKLEVESKNYVTLSIFFVLFNPFFLQNIYFHFDSIIMLISVLLIFITIEKNIKKEILLIIFVLFLYQPSVIGYPVIVCLNLLNLIFLNKNRFEIYGYLASRLFVFIGAFSFFYIISKIFIETNNYSVNHFTIVSSLNNFYENIFLSFSILNFSNYYFEYSLIFLFFTFCFIFIFFALDGNNNILIFDKILIGFGFLIVCILSLLNINIVLEFPRLYSRTYIGFGFLLFFFVISSIMLFSHFNTNIVILKYFNLFKVCVVVFLLLLVNISFVNFNYFKYKNKENERIINFIDYDLSTFNNKYFESINIGGNLSLSMQEETLTQRYPIVRWNFLDFLNAERHRFFYVEIRNRGYNFNSDGFYNRNNRIMYNANINKKASITRKYYDLIYINGNVFIYLKDNGARTMVDLDKSRLD